MNSVTCPIKDACGGAELSNSRLDGVQVSTHYHLRATRVLALFVPSNKEDERERETRSKLEEARRRSGNRMEEKISASHEVLMDGTKREEWEQKINISLDAETYKAPPHR